MEFNGNTLKIKNKIYAIDNIKNVEYSEKMIRFVVITIPLMFLFAPIFFFYTNIFMIIIYILLFGLSFVKIKIYSIFIDNTYQAAFITTNESDFIAYKKELTYHMENRQHNIVKSKKIKDIKSIEISESAEEYKIRRRKEAFNRNLKKQEEIYENKYEESHKEFTVNNIKVKDKEARPKMSSKEKKEKGDDYEKKIAGYYKLDGYDIYLNGIRKNRLDGGIDVICKKDDETILIQCKNWDHTTGRRISHTQIKEFHSNCIKYIEQNELIKENVKLKYIVPNKKVFKGCAIEIFRDDYYNCKYEILEF